jgi:hypothetical protein
MPLRKPSAWVVIRDAESGEAVEVMDDNDSCHPYAGGDYNGHCGGCDMCMIMQMQHYGYKVENITPLHAAVVGAILRERERHARHNP